MGKLCSHAAKYMWILVFPWAQFLYFNFTWLEN